MTTFTTDLALASWMPRSACMRLRTDHVLFLPYTPRGMTASGLWLERNPWHPRIWGWLAGVPAEVTERQSALRAGAQVVVQRCAGEVVVRVLPPVERYLGHRWDVWALPLDAVQLVIDPPLVDARAA
ncbi:MAG: hypothetical protein KGL39_09060 [Patescibacteria group bacterium]|nr:hypothetical protein [Patescibacteria group bacterium]